MLILTSCSDNERFRTSGFEWTCGFGKCELIPEDLESNDYYMAGYKNGNKVTGVLDYQFARAMWLDDGSGRGGIILATVDCIGLSRTDVEIIRDSLKDFKRESDCRAIHVFSTHTHAGIDTLGLWGPVAVSGRSESFQQIVFNGVKQAATEAYENRRAGKLYHGSAEVEGMQIDSRLPEVYDKTLTSIRFEPNDGTKGIRLVSFAAHAEALRSDNSLLSADYPAYIGYFVETYTGDDFMFINGAIGGLIMTPILEEAKDMVENVKNTGELLAAQVLNIDNEREIRPALNIISEVFDIPLYNQIFVTMSFLGVISTKAVDGEGIYGLSVRTEITYMELGDINILFVPGELFPELAYGGSAGDVKANPTVLTPKPLTKITGDENLIIFGLADDEIGYIIPPDDFMLNKDKPYLENAVDSFGRRHYEETNSLGIDTAECIAKAASSIMKRIDKMEGIK